MARCKCPSYGPNQAYLLSFGDCMTALLAFFIVLNSMAEEQSGANLYAGTGSFNAALNSHGLPGLFSGENSRQVMQHNDVAPLYMVAGEVDEPMLQGNGPDETDDGGRIIDREAEQFSRFLEEARRIATVQQEPGIKAEVSLDVLAALPQDGPLMSPELKATLAQVRPAFSKPDRVIEIVVWATTPSQSAWTRAVEQAQAIRQEAIEYMNLTDEQLPRITAVGRTWISSTLKRPSVSVCLRRLESSSGR